MKEQKEQSAALDKVVALMKSWMLDSQNSEKPVLEHHRPDDLKDLLSLRIGADGVGYEGLTAEIEQYLKYAVKTGHPAYLNQLFGGFNFPAFVGELITALTNTSMYTYEVAPVATLMELELMEKMRSYTGWKTGTGAMLTGGSNTNLVAMLLARNHHFPSVKQQGLAGLPRPVFFVSERSHFSFLKAANALGLGQESVIKVPIDENGRMRGKALHWALESAIERGAQPFMVCSTAGTTETGSFDAFEEIADVAEEFSLWHHIDGSWGGSAILSEKRQHLFQGLDRSDSFSWNPHKMMNIPLVCSVLLVKNPSIPRQEIHTHDGDYIYHENDSSAYDLGPASLQCGRRVDALKLWLAWKFYGDNGYAARIEKLFDLAAYCDTLVKGHPKLELLFPTQTLNVNFRYAAPNGVDADQLNEEIRYRLLRSGEAMVNYCRLDSGLSIRLVLLNPDLTIADLDSFFERFTATGAIVSEELAESSHPI